MTPSIHIKTLLTLATSLLCILTGCSRAESEPENTGHESTIKLSVSTRSQGADPETEITSLRMLIFNADDKSMVLNATYTPADVYSATNDNYVLNAKVQNITNARIFVIANELTQWNLNQGITYGKLLTLETDYYDPTSDFLSDITSPFLMLAGGDRDIPTPPNTITEESLSLVRNVMKVTMNLKQVLTTPGAQAPLTLKKLYIDRVPKRGFLYPGQTYDPILEYTQTAERDLAAIGFDISPDYATLKTAQVFYIPENILEDKAYYSRILITASHSNPAEGGDLLFEIPLGENVQKLYDTPPVTISDLTADDLSALRNTHFVIDATIRLADISTALTVKEWILKEIPGEVTSPYLNISAVEEKVTITFDNALNKWVCNPENIVFSVWTNLNKEELMLDMKVQRDSETPVPLGDVFTYTWSLIEQPDGFRPGAAAATGTLKLRMKNPSPTWRYYKMKVSAKHLSRSFQINATSIQTN